MFDIFISYRRSDSRADTGRLYDRLSAHFGDARVFMDIDDIVPGADFVQSLAASLDRCGVMLVVIGKQWLAGTSPRLAEADDFVRIELERALARNIRMIPILVGGAAMPAQTALPPSLARLARLQAFELSDGRFHQDVDQLIATLEADADGRPQPVAAAGRPPARGTAMRLGLVAIAAVTLLLGLGFWFQQQRTDAALEVQLALGDQHVAAGDFALGDAAYREVLASDTHNVTAYRKIIAATRERFLRDGIGGASNVSLALGANSLHLATIDAAARDQAATDIRTLRALDAAASEDVDVLLDEALIHKASIIDARKALPLLTRAHALAPARADIMAELGLLEVMLDGDPNGIVRVREARALAPGAAQWALYEAATLAQHHRCAVRVESEPAPDEATRCAEAIRVYHAAWDLAGGDSFWDRHIRRYAVAGALDIFHRYAMREQDILTPNLDMSLPERIAEIEFLRTHEERVTRSGPTDYPEYWLATLYAATAQPQRARQMLERLFAQRGQRAPEWIALWEELQPRYQ